MRITSTVFVLLIQTFLCLASDDSQFQLINRATGFCLVKLNNHCNDIRWTSGDRLLVQNKNKCLGVQGKTVGSEVNLYDCDETSELQKWECKNETVIALKGQELYIDLTADNTAVLSNKVAPSSHLTISGTSSGACTRTYTELYTIEGNAAGRPCMFPFFYKSNWYSECTAFDSPGNRKWCAAETKYDHELWGYCPTNSKETWNKDPTTGASYQLNTQSALTWDQADASCKQQSASLLSISNPHEQAYISGKETTNSHFRPTIRSLWESCYFGHKTRFWILSLHKHSVTFSSTDELWIGLNDRNRERLFVWSDHSPVSYTSWDSREPTVTSEQEDYDCPCLACSSECTSITKALDHNSVSYILFKIFTEASEKRKTWYEARDYCRAIGGDLVSIHSSADLLPRPNQYWIGLSAPDPDTGYVWSDGSPVNFQEWSDGEPNNENNAESCAEMKSNYWQKTFFWSDVHCEKYNNWICQVHAEYNTTSDGWLEWNGAQYYINKKAMAMEDARMFCRQRHGDLVSINSEAERIFLWKQVSYQNSWIGLSVDLDGTFQWMDGSQLLFQSWQENQPDFKNFDENCAFMTYHNGFWHDSSCGLEYASICKRSSSTPANTTAAVPTVPPKGGCPHPWKKFNSKCYSIIDNQNLTWHDAREKCKQKGGNLVSITSRDVEGLFHFLFTQICISILLPSPLLWSIYDTTTEFLLLCSFDTSQPDSPEPTISTNYIKILNDSIKVVPQQMNWDKAAEYCKNDDALLASLRNEWTQAYVELLALNLKAPLWFGLHKAQINGSFRYVDGWHLIFSRWGKNEPSKDRSCVYMDVDGKWKTTHCNETLMSVCMKSTDPEATIENKNYIWVPFRGYCYIFITEQKRWQEASTSCVAHGGMLASIEDSSEQKFLEINLRTFQDGYTSFWIGLFKKQHKEEWLWLDKTVISYTNWAEGQPVNGSRLPRRGEISTSDGTWTDIGMWVQRPYICKIQKETGLPHHQRVYITTAVVLVITGIAVVAVSAVFFFKKFGHQLPAPNTFDNPLFFSSRVSQPEQADTNILVENAAEENTGDLISM
uniref:Mannose receptor, C type 1b n=1 Tax=Haplochromis burtoni TaxID=8153 RepID=A0A3Q2VLE5_HAPBU